MEDQQRLLEGLKQGDKKVFEEIYKLYYLPLCFYCHRYVNNLEESKELVQGLFVKIWIKRDELKINTSLKSYLFQSIRNYALNYLKQEKVRNRYKIEKEHLPENRSGNGLHDLEEQELKTLISEAILMLPEKRRRIFELNRFEEMKYNQIAEHLSISVKTVEAQMSKSLQSLRKALKDYLPALISGLLLGDFFRIF